MCVVTSTLSEWSVIIGYPDQLFICIVLQKLEFQYCTFNSYFLQTLHLPNFVAFVFDFVLSCCFSHISLTSFSSQSHFIIIFFYFCMYLYISEVLNNWVSVEMAWAVCFDLLQPCRCVPQHHHGGGLPDDSHTLQLGWMSDCSEGCSLLCWPKLWLSATAAGVPDDPSVRGKH